jgi:hypothetical protein
MDCAGQRPQLSKIVVPAPFDRPKSGDPGRATCRRLLGQGFLSLSKGAETTKENGSG